MQKELSPDVNILFEVLEESAKRIRNYFDKITVNQKHEHDLVTNLDLELEDYFASRLTSVFPGSFFYGEESGGEVDTLAKSWICDPLDGTNNYAIGIPLAGSSLVMIENGEPVLAGLSNAFTNRIYIAKKGQGVFLNQVPFNELKFYGKERAAACVGYKVFENDVERKKWYDLNDYITRLKKGRYFHSWAPVIDFDLLFRGELEALLFYKNETHDLLGGSLISRELGYEIFDVQGNNWSWKVGQNFSTLLITREKKMELSTGILQKLKELEGI
jgi:myo-inositol-1(or 4)-monophosphatase